jgi:hypothetical protein
MRQAGRLGFIVRCFFYRPIGGSIPTGRAVAMLGHAEKV